MDSPKTCDRIAIVEPRCIGFEHVPFNAALIAAALEAFPLSRVDVYAETQQLAALRDLVTATRSARAPRVAWCAVTVPPRKARGRARFTPVRRLIAALDREFRLRPPAALIFASVDALDLSLLKMKLFTAWAAIPTIAVFHEFTRVFGRRRVRSSRWWGAMAAVAAPHPRQLTYAVLGGSIRSRLCEIAPKLATHVIAIDHPSLLGDMPQDPVFDGAGPLRFGFVGGGREAKGLKAFVEVASSVTRTHPNVTFEIVGSVPANTSAKDLTHLTWSTEKLPLVEFVRRLRSLSYVVWLGDPNHYELVASGSLVDSIAVGIPVICLRGSFVNYLFSRFGEIGFRCDTLSEIERQVLHLSDAFSPERYRELTHNVLAARAMLTPEACADALRVALSRVNT